MSFQTYTVIKNIRLFRTFVRRIQIYHHKLLSINKLQYFQFHTKKWRILIKKYIQREISLKKIRHNEFFHYAYFIIQVGLFCFNAFTQLYNLTFHLSNATSKILNNCTSSRIIKTAEFEGRSYNSFNKLHSVTALEK